MPQNILLLGTNADILDGLKVVFKTLEDSIKHWYVCEGGKYIVRAIGSVSAARNALPNLGAGAVFLEAKNVKINKQIQNQILQQIKDISIRGFVSVDEHSSALKTLDDVI